MRRSASSDSVSSASSSGSSRHHQRRRTVATLKELAALVVVAYPLKLAGPPHHLPSELLALVRVLSVPVACRRMLRAGSYGVAVLDEQRLACARFDTIDVWDWRRNALVRTLRGHREFVSAVAVLPNAGCQSLLSAALDNSLRTWDILAGRCSMRLRHGHAQRIWCLRAFGTEHSLAVSASADATLRLWDLRVMKSVSVFAGHTSDVFSAAVTLAQGPMPLLVSGSADRTVRVWDTRQTRDALFQYKHDHPVYDVDALGDDRHVLVVGAGCDVSLVNYREGFAARAASPVTSVSASTSRPQAGRSGSRSSSHGSSNGSSAGGGTSAQHRSFQGHSASVTCVRGFGNGVNFASGSEDGTVRVWNVAEAKAVAVLNGRGGVVRDLAAFRDRYLRQRLLHVDLSTMYIWQTRSASSV